MSWDERGCFGSAQCAHKNVKCLRGLAKSQPTHIYRGTPSKRAVGLITGAQDAPTLMHWMHPAASGAPIVATCPCSFKDQWSIQQPPDASNACTQRPMWSSKGPEPVLTHRTRPTARHRTLQRPVHAKFCEAADIITSPDARTVHGHHPMRNPRTRRCTALHSAASSVST
jgi:hypothetical protein